MACHRHHGSPRAAATRDESGSDTPLIVGTGGDLSFADSATGRGLILFADSRDGAGACLSLTSATGRHPILR